MEYGIGTKVFGDWQIIRELGEGASGKVYEIMKADFRLTANTAPRSALKVIRVPKSASEVKAAMSEGQDEASVTAYFQEFVDEIVKEIVMLSGLKGHPNIVDYEDHCVIEHEDGIGWDILIRMELLTPLTDYLTFHVMEEPEVLKLAKDLCNALIFCQEKGMIHRDIKPQNIFISKTGKTVQFKLGDFGVARTIEKTSGGLTRIGTEIYMAPEVYLNRPYGKSVDIYSLGLVLYSLLNGNRLPFLPPAPGKITKKDRDTALDKRMNGELFPEPLHAGSQLAKVVLKACSFNPDQRYHTAEEMSKELERICISPETEGVWQKKEETVNKDNKTWDPGLEETYGARGNGFNAEDEDPQKPERGPGKWWKMTLKTGAVGIALAAVGVGVFWYFRPIQEEVVVNRGAGDGKYKSEEIVYIEADEPESGYRFSKWVVDSRNVNLLDEKSQSTSFMMPEEDVEITACYTKASYQLQVNYADSIGTQEIETGKTVKIQAKDAEDGTYIFTGWKIEKGNVELEDAAAQSTSFTMPQEDVEITAEYKKCYHLIVENGEIYIR